MRITLIDDDRAVLRLVEMGLLHGGHEVTSFTNPLKAVDEISEKTDLVISDICMPVMDGFRLAEAVEEKLGFAPQRVILMTGYDGCRGGSREIPMTVLGIVHKPFAFEWLLCVLAAVERARTECPGVVYRELECGGPGDSESSASHRNGHCHTPAYALCPGYFKHVGERFRDWVASDGRAVMTPLK